GIVEVALLAVGAGLIGTWIVLRGLAFFTHAVGTAAFPGLVLADGLGFGAALGAAGSALLVAAAVAWLSRRDRDRYDASTALVLAEGVAGLWLSVEANAPPGPAIAVLAGGAFAVVAVGRAVVRRTAGLPVAGAALVVIAALAVAGCGGVGTASGGHLPVVATT